LRSAGRRYSGSASLPLGCGVSPVKSTRPGTTPATRRERFVWRFSRAAASTAETSGESDAGARPGAAGAANDAAYARWAAVVGVDGGVPVSRTGRVYPKAPTKPAIYPR